MWTSASSPLLALAALAARILPASLRQALYGLGPVSRLLRRALNRAAPTGLTEVPVAAGGLRGARLLLDLQSEKDLWLATYEPDLQKALREFAFPGATAYDIGAHIGYVSLLLARAVGPDGLVFAFEPLPANFDRLRRNIELNHLGQHVHPIPAAVSDYTGRARFLAHPSSAMGKVEGSAGRSDIYPEAIEVECLSLDDFVFARCNPPPDLVKIDIEGGEGKVLLGMARLLSEHPSILLVELHGPEAAAAVLRTLQDRPYRLHHLQAGYPPLDPARFLPWKTYLLALPPGFEAGGR